MARKEKTETLFMQTNILIVDDEDPSLISRGGVGGKNGEDPNR